MLIAIDAGNTHTVIGLFDGETRRAAWRLATRSQQLRLSSASRPCCQWKRTLMRPYLSQ